MARSSIGQGEEDHFDALYRRHFNDVYAGKGARYEAYRAAYRFGREQARNAGNAGRTYAQAEEDLKARYELQHPSHAYEAAREAVRYGFDLGEDVGPLEEDSALRRGNEAAMAEVDRAQINTEGEPPSPSEAMERAASMAVGPPVGSDTVHHSAATDYSLYDERFKEHFEKTYGAEGDSKGDSEGETPQGTGYAGHESAYRLGLELSREDRYRGRPFSEAEPEARQIYEQRHPNRSYADVREAVRYGYEPLRS